MGFNTTVVILNDALHEIEADPEFGKKLGAAIRELSPTPIWVAAGHHGNAAVVVESHHADHLVVVEVGLNMGKVILKGVRH